MMEQAVVVTGVTKHYPRHVALAGVSLTIPAGVCLALLGHNGAGKTTLMKLLLGLTRPTDGEVRVLGRNPAVDALALRRQIGFLPEHAAFYDEMSGRDTLHYFARLKRESLNRCNALLERVGLLEAADRRVKTYSKGMRQRLGLAQALLGQPALLLLDEPTTGLDPLLRLEFFRIIHELSNEGTTVILSSHILTELEARTDLVAILRQGQLEAFGSLASLRQQAALPLRLRLTVTGDGPPLARAVALGHGVWEVSCPVADKMALLRQVAGLGEQVQDVEILPPTLDDLYVHFGHRPQTWEES